MKRNTMRTRTRALSLVNAASRTSSVAVFDTLTLQQAQRYLVEDPTTRQAKAFYGGDHWQGGAGWIGPMPRDETGAPDPTVLIEIQRGFISRNVIKEVIDRHVSGVLGHEPAWRLVPRRAITENDDSITPQEQALIDEAEAAMTELWDMRKVLRTMKDTMSKMLQSKRACARAWVPEGLLLDAGTTIYADQQFKVLSATTLAEGLLKVFVESPTSDQAAIYTEPTTQRQVGIYVYTDDAGHLHGELSYLDTDGVTTIVRTLDQFAGTTTRLPVNYGGRLPMYQVSRPRLITEQLMSLQRALNLALTVIPRNVVTGGFLERVLLNAQLPGKWITDPDTGKRIRFEPAPYVTGSGSTNFVQGEEITDETGKTSIARADIRWRPPVDAIHSVKAADSIMNQMLESVEQAHILISGDAQASGKSREQARADFNNSLLDTAQEAASLVRWYIELALSIAELALGTPGKYTSVLRAECQCVVNTGPLSSLERKANTDDVAAGLMSDETAMARNSIDDVDAEKMVIAESPNKVLSIIKDQALALNQLALGGIPLDVAVQLVGFTDEQIAMITPALNAAAKAPTPETGNPSARALPPTAPSNTNRQQRVPTQVPNRGQKPRSVSTSNG